MSSVLNFIAEEMCALHDDRTSSIEVFYHANCHDGHVAAFTLWLDLRDKENIEVNYHPIQHGTKPPDVTGKIVYILDFSFPLDVIKTMIEQAQALLVIDHHKTSQDNLADIPDKNKIFDMEECGATLTWKYMNPDEDLPLLYQYIRSYDIWTKDMKDTDAFNLAFELAVRNEEGKYDFKLTERYLDSREIEGLISVGKIMKAYHDSLVEKSLRKSHFCPIRRDDKILIVAYVNVVPALTNDVGSRCMSEYPFVDFCACYYIDPSAKATQFSLRSRDGCQDVSIIAKDHGGGGHRNASGCRLKGITSQLKYDHLDPWPLWCMYTNKKLEATQDNIGELLSSDYLQLLKLRFPGRTLQIDLKLSE